MSNRNQVLVIMAVGIALRVPGLFRSLWYDEMLTVYASTSLHALPTKILEHYHAPLFLVLNNLAMKLTGVEAIWRIPSVLAAVASIPAMYSLGRTLAGSRAGILAAGLLSVSIFHIEHSTELRPYSFLVLFSIWTFDFFWRAIRSGSRRDWVFFSLCSAGALYSHFAALFLVSSLALAALILRWMEGAGAWGPPLSRNIGRDLLESMVLVALLYAPVWPSLARLTYHYFETGVVGTVPTMNVGGSLGLDFMENLLFDFSGRMPHSAVLFGLAFLAGCVSLVGGRDRRAVLVLTVLGLPLLFIYIVRPGHFVVSRYLIHLLPLFLVVVALGFRIGFVWVWGRFSAAAWTGRQFAVSAALFVIVSVAPGSSLIAWVRADDWRDVTAYLGASMTKGERLYFEPGVKSPGMVRRYATDELKEKMIERGTLPWINPAAARPGKSNRAWVIHRVPIRTRRPPWLLADTPAMVQREFHMVNADVTVLCFDKDVLIPVLQRAGRTGGHRSGGRSPD